MSKTACNNAFNTGEKVDERRGACTVLQFGSVQLRGVVFPGDRRVAFETFPDPSPGPGEVVLGIRASGMCGSDLHTYRRPAASGPFTIAGHEPAGDVLAVGAGVRGDIARVGARVMVHHYFGCTTCEHCKAGWAQLCKSVPVQIFGNNEHGAHAPYMKVPAETLVPLDDALSYAAGAAISCGTGTAWGALERMHFTGAETIAVFGQGPVGLSATMFAAAMGARVIALDINSERRQLAKRFGASDAIDPTNGGAVAAIEELTRGRGVQMAMETSGSSAAGADTLASLGVWGTACFVGIGTTVSFDVRAYLPKQITILTSWTMSLASQRECAAFAIRKRLDLDSLFSHRWKLSEAEAAYKVFDQQSSGKGVFVA